MSTAAALPSRVPAFQHEAMFYAGRADFLPTTLPFVSAGLARDESVMVAVSAEKAAEMQAALGADARRVTFVDMAGVGRNPARIIPVWRDFIDAAGGRGARGIGEPVWPERTPAELLECQLHEALLNTAFDGGPGWVLACPYDTETLAPDVLAEAHRSHPVIVDGGRRQPSAAFSPDAASLAGRLPPAPAERTELGFGHDDLPTLRRTVVEQALGAGLDPHRTDELVLAAHEIATNSLRHGGGRGVLRIWQEPGVLVCEVADAGYIPQLLVGRQRPGAHQEGGRGVWLANQLCDLVQVRTSLAGTVVRLYVSRP